ncbi:MAG: DUF445 family protein [Candidatus Binataceae bacterium]|nr:DUF445 family protein [Candidatus Binataceae bacterium]
MNSKETRGFIGFIEKHKGAVALTLSFALYLASWPLELIYPSAANIVRAAGEASLIGGLCDYIALNMLFEEHWYLPKSGVLPRNRDRLIEGIAEVIEREWLTPEMIGDKIHALTPLDRLGDYLKTASLRTVIRPEQLQRMCTEAARYLQPENAVALIQQLSSGIRKSSGPLDRIRLVLLKAVVSKECARIRQLVRGLPQNEELLSAADTHIHELGAHLCESSSTVRKTADHWMDELVGQVVLASRGEIARMVKENLNQFSNEDIRTQIESRTRTHLDWIRVNGGVFGAILGCAFALLNAAHPETLIHYLALHPHLPLW